MSVKNLIAQVKEGRLRVPDFQRPLRWKSDDVVKLFDSLWRGYPIGSLLLWKKSAESNDKLPVGGATIQAPAFPDALWIVDGQQRVTALAAALLDLDHGGQTQWIVRYDPDQHQFLAGWPKDSEKGKHVPLSVLGDLRRLGRWLRGANLQEEQISEIEDVQQRILDFDVPHYTMETENADALRGVFSRMNSSGVRMRADEIFQALVGTRSAGRTSLDLDKLQRATDGVDNFGQPPRGEVYKAVLAMDNRDPNHRLDQIGEGHQSVDIDGDEAAKAIEQAARFLVDVAGIPRYSLIPYPVAFIVLARWFYCFPQSEESTQCELARWLWKAAALELHQRGRTSALRDQISSIVDDERDASLQRLMVHVRSIREIESWELKKFNQKNARSRIEMLALLSLQPRDPQGLVSIVALASGDRMAREIWTIPYIEKSCETETLDMARTAANRILLDDVSTGLSTTLKKWPRDSDAFASHLIDHVCIEALHNDNGEHELLRRRKTLLEERVVEFLSAKIGVGRPIVLPASTYADNEE